MNVTIRKFIMLFLLVFLMPVILSACYDSHELDDWAYTDMIGVDIGSVDQLRFSFHMPQIKGASGGTGTGGVSGSLGITEHILMSVDCPTFNSGINMVNTSLSRTLSFTQVKYLVISEALARKGVGRFINGMLRNPQIRRSINVIVAKGTAKDFIDSFNPVMGTSITKTQELLMQHQYESGFFDEVLLNEFETNLRSFNNEPTAALGGINSFKENNAAGPPPEQFKSAGDYYAGELPRTGGNRDELFGTALFSGDKMVGELNGDETQAMLMMRGEFRDANITIADPLDPKLRIAFLVQKRKSPDVKIVFNGGEPVIHVKVFLQGTLGNLQSGINYESEEYKPVLEKAMVSFIKGQLDKTINKCRDLNCEVFYFGETAAMQFLTIQEMESYKWESHFKNAEVTTEVEFIMKRTGTMMKTSEIISGED